MWVHENSRNSFVLTKVVTPAVMIKMERTATDKMVPLGKVIKSLIKRVKKVIREKVMKVREIMAELKKT